MESKVEFNLSVGAKFTGSASGDLSAIIAEAKIQLGIEVSMNVSIGQSFTTRYGPIAAGKYGHIQFGDWGYAINWSLYRGNGNCTSTYLAGGGAILPNPINLGHSTWSSNSANG
jgi:hypothetical protein